MLLIVNNSTAIENPAPSAVQRALDGVFDVVLLDSQVPEQGYLRGGMLDEDLFDLEYVTPTIYERAARPISLGELVSTLQAFASGADWRRNAPWEAVDEESPYVDGSALKNPAATAIEPPPVLQAEMRALGCWSVLVGFIIFPLLATCFYGLGISQYRYDIGGAGYLMLLILAVCLAMYYSFGAIPLRRAAARWWSLLLNVTIVEKWASPRHPLRALSNTRYHWAVAEAGTGRDALVWLLDAATVTVVIGGPLLLFLPGVALVKAVF